jgi:hypothetical protein
VTFPISSANPPVRLLAAFQHAYPSLSPEWFMQAPGRDMWLLAAPCSNETFSIYAAELDQRTTFNWRTAKAKRTIASRPLPRWARYPAGVVLALQEDGLSAPGVEAAILGDEPAGPRYEHALGITLAALWYDLLAQPYTPAGLIDLLDRVRRDYVDT